MPKISPKARRALTEERRKQILDAASQVFAERGFDRATIADIAKAAGVAEGSIYNYFKNKGDLLVSIPRQILQAPVESVSARMSLLADSTPLPPEQMLALVARNMLNAVEQNAAIFRILVSALPTMNKATREKYLNHVVMYAAGTLQSYFEKQIEHGVFRRDLDAPILARAFIGMFFPFVLLRVVLQIDSEQEWNHDHIIDTLVPVFLRGVLSDSEHSLLIRRQKIPVE